MAQYPETSRNRRRASVALLDPVAAGVPTRRLCPSGVPNKAMDARVPNRRMVPTLLWRTRTLDHRFGCLRHNESFFQSANGSRR